MISKRYKYILAWLTRISYLAVMVSLVFLVVEMNCAVRDFRTSSVKVLDNASTTLVNVDKYTADAMKQLKLAIMSLHGIIFDIRKNFTSNNDRQTAILDNTFRTLDGLNGNMRELVGAVSNVIEKKGGPVLDNINELVSEVRFGARAVSLELIALLGDVRGSVALIINNKLAGFIEASTLTVNGLDKELRKMFGNASIVLEDVHHLSEKGDEIAFHVAKITQDASELSAYAKQKFLKPTKWDYFKRILNIASFGLGEIVIPAFVVKNVRVIN